MNRFLKKLLSALVVALLLFSPVSGAKTEYPSKPPIGAQIDWGHPLARKMIACLLINESGGNNIVDLCRGLKLTFANSTTSWDRSYKGIGIRHDANGEGANVLAPSYLKIDATISEYTIMWGGIPLGATPNGQAEIFGISYDNAASPPYLCMMVGIKNDSSGWFGDNEFGSLWYTDMNAGTIGFGRYGTLAYTHKGAFANCYLNGKLGSLVSKWGATYSATSYFSIGDFKNFNKNTNALSLYGYIWERKLSQKEILQIHASPYCFLKAPEPWYKTAAAAVRRMFITS